MLIYVACMEIFFIFSLFETNLFNFTINKKLLIKMLLFIRFSKNLILFGYCFEITTDSICDLIILIAKYYIYRCKVQKLNLNIQCFIRELYNRYCVEKIVYKSSVVFRNKWGPYLNISKSIL